MNALWSLIIGISSSLVATALFITLSEIVRRIVLPWYADRIYRGVRIDGKWTACTILNKAVDPSKDPEVQLELKQTGDNVSGTCIIRRSHDSPADSLKVVGEIRDAVFGATIRPASPYHIDAGTVLLRVFASEDRLRMSGVVSFMSQKSAEIQSAKPVEFIRADPFYRPPTNPDASP